MANRKFFWLKLQKDFFKRHDIKIIEAMENGKDYLLFYLKLLCESVDHEGNLRFSETIPYDDRMLATITGTNVDIVRSAIKVFTSLNMIEILDDKTIFMSEVTKMIGCEGASAERMRRLRASQCDTLVLKSDVEIEKEIELDIELEKEIELNNNNISSSPTQDAGSPSLDEIEAYFVDRGLKDAKGFYEHYTKEGWQHNSSRISNCWRPFAIAWSNRH